MCRTRFAKPALQIVNILGEGLWLCRGAVQGLRSQSVGSRRAAQAEVDTVSVHIGKRAVLFCDHQRGMVGQHHSTGTKAYAFSDGGCSGNQQGCSRGCKMRHIMVFGEPEPVIPQLVGQARRFHGRVDSVLGRGAFIYWNEIEDA